MRKTVTGSHSGTGWWLAQRVSAVVMLIAGVILFTAFIIAAPFDHESWRQAFSGLVIRLLAWLLVASLCLHAWIGLRDVLMDYVKSILLRLVLNVLFMLILTACVFWAAEILWWANG